MPRLKRILLILIPVIVLPLVFALDIVRMTVDLGISGLGTVRELALLASFASIGIALGSAEDRTKHNVPKDLGRLLLFYAAVLAAIIFMTVTSLFGGEEGQETSVRYVAIHLLGTYIVGILVTVVAIVTLQRLRSMVLHKRTRGVRRNFLLFLGALGTTVLLSMPFIPPAGGILTYLSFTIAVILAVVNAFRQSWIVYLSRREKIYALVYAFLLFVVLTILDVLLAQRSDSQRAMLGFSPPIHAFVQITCLFATFYAGMAFVSTLFHLPTAEVFERKQSELNSLHNLGRLVTQVFDFEHLVETVTHMATEVSGARSAWLELFDQPGASVNGLRVVARQHASQQEIALFEANVLTALRKTVRESGKYSLIEDLWEDRRTKSLRELGVPKLALLSIPLVSHGALVGILHATKRAEQGFDQDDIDVLTGFSDYASITIENARLFLRSLERERLEQEMMLAQRMQKRLLPQTMPSLPGVEFAAVSESSAEVGGDYYDVFELSHGRYGLVVADVSGKGVSAAFYMAVLKGIFLSLVRLDHSPRELLVKANRALLESLEKNAFISVVYAVLDTKSGDLVMARAGHCPVVYASAKGTELIRPNGLGLGLTEGRLFAQSTEERVIRLATQDVCVFYTDGVTEARNAREEEFGYDRLIDAVQRHKTKDAAGIKDGILQEIRTFLENSAYNDDMTLVVIKWLARAEEKSRVIS